MKNLFILLSFFLSLNTYAQPKPKPVESVRINNNILYQTVAGVETQRGSVVGILPDVNGNIVTGLNPNIDSRSESNWVLRDNVVLVNSDENFINCRNAQIYDSKGNNLNGADHTVKWSSYCSVENDANLVYKSESSSTKGTGNKQYSNGGSIVGNNDELGDSTFIYYNSTIKGDNCKVKGDRSHAIGNWIRIQGNDIIVIGNATPGTPIFTEPGVHIIGQVVPPQPFQGTNQKIEIRGYIDRMGNWQYLFKN